MLTYQDFLESGKNGETGRIDFIERAIKEHKESEAYQIAKDAECYDRQQNVTIMKLQKWLYTMKGSRIPDIISPNHKLRSNFFNRFTTQLVQYLLGNGVTFPEDGIKEKLGPNFDTQLQYAEEEAVNAGTSFGLWDYKKMRVFKFTEFAPIYDEENGSLRLGIRFWQLAHDKPLRVTLYEEDGYTEYRKRKDSKMEVMVEKRPYKLVVKTTIADGSEIVNGYNYPSFPIVPLYANKYHQSMLVGLRENIDAYDLIKSGFANDLDGHMLYWLIKNAGGMDDADVARMIERIKTIGAAISTEEGSIEQKQINIPYESRIAYLDRIEQDLYKDAGIMKVENITAGGTTATQIKASYVPQDMKANAMEYQCIEFIQSILRLQGIESTPQFKRDKIVNVQEETTVILQAAPYLDDETILKKLPFLTNDEVKSVLKAKKKEEVERYAIAKDISQGKGFNGEVDDDEDDEEEEINNGGDEKKEEERENKGKGKETEPNNAKGKRKNRQATK